MTIFDVAVLAAGAIAVLLGFRSGLLRSALTILGYIAALPIATWATSLVPSATAAVGQPFIQNSLVFFGLFLVLGMALSLLLRFAVDDLVGSRIGLADRLGGAALGAIRVGLIAVALVMIAERLIPANLQPAYLADSRLRPTLSAIAATGLKSLPPDMIAQIDRLKRERRI